MSLFEVTEYDKKVYETELKDWLPDNIIDIHAHIWKGKIIITPEMAERQVVWPFIVGPENTYDDIQESYRLFFPGKRTTPLLMAQNIEKLEDVKPRNDYVIEAKNKLNLKALYFFHPKQTPEEIESIVKANGFVGLKSYLSLSPSYIPQNEIRILDFFRPEILEVADRLGLLVMLHIPRAKRLKDPVNIAEIKFICEHYKNLKLIIAHVGRAYSVLDIGNAFDEIGFYDNLWYDFTANTNEDVFVSLLQHFPYDRVMFGSDEPITRMRMHRIDENGKYINMVPPGLYGDPKNDPHLREVSSEEAKKLTFFMYEEILSMKRACLRVGCGNDAAERIFYKNAKELIES